eukprot:2916204-Prymnesium_polylepis.1
MCPCDSLPRSSTRAPSASLRRGDPLPPPLVTSVFYSASLRRGDFSPFPGDPETRAANCAEGVPCARRPLCGAGDYSSSLSTAMRATWGEVEKRWTKDLLAATIECARLSSAVAGS